MKIIELDEVDSTNEYCKRSQCGNLIVTAVRQSNGKGTKGRSFVSDEGGLYISIKRSFSDFAADEAFKIMVNSCVAVCKTVEEYGLKPNIRWANDVLVRGKKICGTLIENTFSGNKITRSIVGMGINVKNVLPPELQHIATTLEKECSTVISVNGVRNRLINNLKKTYSVNDYKSYIDWFGKEVILKTEREELKATAVDVDYDGGLLCVVGGSLKKISSGEVSLRL